MTITTNATTASPPRGSHGAAVRALATLEAWRMLRHPLLVLGLAVSVWLIWTTVPQDEQWAGETYSTLMVVPVPFLAALSLVVALAFHRQRHDVGDGAPVSPAARAGATLAATLPLLTLSAALAVLVAWRERAVGGLRVGNLGWGGPETVHTVAELSQYLALALLAVGLGAALGRRAARPAAFVAVLVVGWFLASTYWLFSHPFITAFSVVQVQPLSLYAGQRGTDPTTLPAEWRLEPPGTYSDHWSRLFLSEALAWWHTLWLVGLAVALVSVALPRGRARVGVLALGVVAAVTGVAGQFAVIP